MNKAINVAAVAFDYCEKHGRLHPPPMKGIERYGDDSREVGILSTDEVEALFSAEWGKPVCRLANMLAATTGMRAGEISGLRYCDLGKDRILINHAWGINDGLKSTKTNKKREIAVLQSMISALKELAEENPSFSQDSFVFWSPIKKGLEPYLPGYWEDDFYATLSKIGISKEMRQERNVVFHSWQHFYATQISQRAQERLTQESPCPPTSPGPVPEGGGRPRPFRLGDRRTGKAAGGIPPDRRPSPGIAPGSPGCVPALRAVRPASRPAQPGAWFPLPSDGGQGSEGGLLFPPVIADRPRRNRPAPAARTG